MQHRLTGYINLALLVHRHMIPAHPRGGHCCQLLHVCNSAPADQTQTDEEGVIRMVRRDNPTMTSCYWLGVALQMNPGMLGSTSTMAMGPLQPYQTWKLIAYIPHPEWVQRSIPSKAKKARVLQVSVPPSAQRPEWVQLKAMLKAYRN